MQRILVIQFRKNQQTIESEQQAILRARGESNVECVFINALDTSLPWETPEKLLEGVSGVILGGSGDYSFDGGESNSEESRTMSRTLLTQITPLLSYIFEKDIPTLGICYGHQLIGAFKGVEVVHDPKQSKVGSHSVKLLIDTKDMFLFADVPEEFHAQYGHKDALSTIPEGATLVLEGPNCAVSALQYSKHIFTTQFHPELTAEDVIRRFEQAPQYLPEGTMVESIVKESKDAEKILSNFFSWVGKTAQ